MLQLVVQGIASSEAARVVTTLPPVQIEGDQPIPEVEAILASLAGTLSDEDRPEFDHDIALIRALLVPEGRFSVEEYVTNEVASALQD